MRYLLMEEKHREIFERIVQSKSFGRSRIYKRLLEYLIECSEQGAPPKEMTIAADVFEVKDFEASENTQVRVYLYNLRKKLKAYYLQEGAGDRVRLEVPKGSYKIVLRDNARNHRASVGKRLLIPALTMCILLTGLCAYLGWKLSNAKSLRQPSELLVDLVESDKNLYVVLGDLFIYQKRDSVEGRNLYVRDGDINSRNDYEDFLRTNPGERESTTELSFSFLLYGSATWIKELTTLLQPYQKDFTIRSNSRFNPQDLYDNDLMVIGMMKNLSFFQKYFDNSAFNFEPPVTLTYKTDSAIYSFQPSGNPDAYHSDWSFIAKLPGPSGNKVYLLSGGWDTGASHAVANFTNPVFRTNLEEAMKARLGEIPEYYEAAFQVSGVDRMELDSKLLYIDSLPDDHQVW